MPLTNGEVFAGYVIQRLLGSGGMGEVYLANHPRLPRMDALKILPASLTNNADYQQRFNREADLAASLWHPHIVGIHDRGEFNGQLWISMDYVNGTDAGRLLAERYRNGMPEQDVREIITAVADALDFAHRRRLMHRDVKPSNILLTESDVDERRILLADFGIARQADDISGLTVTNMTVGSVAYAAPEQLMGEDIDGRADEYALAATAFHLLTGAPPFPHSNPAVVISKQLNTPAPSLAEHRPGLAHLDAALSKALAKDRANRYPRCLDFVRAFSREESGPPTRAVTTPPARTRPLSMRPPGPGTATPPRHDAAPPLPPPTTRLRPPTGTPPAPADTAPPPPTTRLRPPTGTPPAPADTAPPPPPPSPPVGPAHPPPEGRPSRRDAATPTPPRRPTARSDRYTRQATLVLAAVVILLAAVCIGGIAYWKYSRSGPASAVAPSGIALEPNAQGDVIIGTKSGKTHCKLSTETVVCAAPFTHSPMTSGQHANEVTVTPDGELQWSTGQIGAVPDLVTVDYLTYSALGWTIAASSTGTRFTNDTTGHGMFVSIDNVNGF